MSHKVLTHATRRTHVIRLMRSGSSVDLTVIWHQSERGKHTAHNSTSHYVAHYSRPLPLWTPSTGGWLWRSERYREARLWMALKLSRKINCDIWPGVSGAAEGQEWCDEQRVLWWWCEEQSSGPVGANRWTLEGDQRKDWVDVIRGWTRVGSADPCKGWVEAVDVSVLSKDDP